MKAHSYYLNVKVMCTYFWQLNCVNIFVADCTMHARQQIDSVLNYNPLTDYKLLMYMSIILMCIIDTI